MAQSQRSQPSQPRGESHQLDGGRKTSDTRRAPCTTPFTSSTSTGTAHPPVEGPMAGGAGPGLNTGFTLTGSPTVHEGQSHGELSFLPWKGPHGRTEVWRETGDSWGETPETLHSAAALGFKCVLQSHFGDPAHPRCGLSSLHWCRSVTETPAKVTGTSVKRFCRGRC